MTWRRQEVPDPSIGVPSARKRFSAPEQRPLMRPEYMASEGQLWRMRRMENVLAARNFQSRVRLVVVFVKEMFAVLCGEHRFNVSGGAADIGCCGCGFRRHCKPDSGSFLGAQVLVERSQTEAEARRAL